MIGPTCSGRFVAASGRTLECPLWGITDIREDRPKMSASAPKTSVRNPERGTSLPIPRCGDRNVRRCSVILLGAAQRNAIAGQRSPFHGRCLLFYRAHQPVGRHNHSTARHTRVLACFRRISRRSWRAGIHQPRWDAETNCCGLDICRGPMIVVSLEQSTKEYSRSDD